MRVLIVGLNYAPEPTGIAPYTTRIAEGLQRRGHDVSVITAFPHYPEWRVAKEHRLLRAVSCEKGVLVRRVRHYVPRVPKRGRRAFSELTFGAHATAVRWPASDVVVATSPALLSTALVQAKARSAFGVHVQDLYSVGSAETGQGGSVIRALSAIEGRVLRAADGVAVIHDRFKSRVVSDLGVHASRVTVIRNWTHIGSLIHPDQCIRQRLGWGHDFVVLHAGAMGEKQGLENVVAAARLAESRGLPIRFVLVGNGGQRRTLENAAVGTRCLQVLDPLPDELYVQALHAADLLLVNELPGVAEMAVPSKLTSYLSTGRPVLAATSSESATADEVAASGAGLRVEPGSPEALVDGVNLLRADPAGAATMGANGPLYCDRVLNENAALDVYDDWIVELYDRHRRLRGS